MYLKFYLCNLFFTTYQKKYLFCNALNIITTEAMTHLKIGDKAPCFKGKTYDGNTIELENFKDKELVLYFYPRDNTPGCTAQACNLRDNYNALLKAGYAVVGVSADSINAHQKFAEKYELPFPLIADTEKEILKAYGVWGPKKFLGKTYDGIHRTTFVISKEGIINEVIQKVDTKNHTNQILK